MSQILTERAEFNWLLEVDVESTIQQLIQILNDCSAIFQNNTPQNHNLLYCSQNHLDVIKINLNLKGYCITEADINIKLTSKHPSQTIKTCILSRENNSGNNNNVNNTPIHMCWVLHQIQDAINHLGNAIDLLISTQMKQGSDNKRRFDTAEEVLHMVDNVMNCLQKSRSSLLIPKKRVIEELQHSRNMQSIRPALPLDYSISFYIQGHNLVCSVYHLSQNNTGPLVKAEYQAELSLGFLSDALVFLSLGLQTCQQLNDKLKTFSYL